MEHDQLVSLLNEKIELAGKRIIEIGCSEGWHTAAFARHNPRMLYGIDPNPEYIAAARKRGIPDARFEVGTLTDLPVGGGSFDVVVFMRSLHQIPVRDMHAAITEAIRVSVWNGHIVFVEPGFRGTFYDAERDLGLNDGDKTFQKHAARKAMRTHPGILLKNEWTYQTTFELDTINSFTKLFEPQSEKLHVLEYLRKMRFVLTAERVVTHFRVR